MDISKILPQDVLAALMLVIILVAVDILLGIVLSIKEGKFDVRTLPRFLQQNIMPYIGGLLVLAIGVTTSPEIRVLFFAAVVAATGKFLADIKDKIVSIFGSGINSSG